MASGDLITLDHQYEYNGLLFGSGTQYQTERWDGLFDMPNLRNSDLNRNDGHGVVPGQDLYGSRTMSTQINLLVGSEAAMYDAIEAWQTAMLAKQNEFPLSYKLPGRAIRYINCRPRKSSLPKDYDLAHGHGVIALQMSASDPRHFEHFAQVANLDLNGTAITKSSSINVPGNWTTEGVFTIHGPCTNIRLSVSGQNPLDGVSHNGRSFGIDVILNSTDVLILNMATKQIMVNGLSRYDIKRTDAQWWSLFPGNNTITYTRANTNNGAISTCQLSYQPAWMY